MPTQTIPSALIKLTSLGIPWDYPAWQASTGVKHGLFPADPQLLPKGWTPEDASNIQSFFDQYLAKPTEDEKMIFVSQRRGAALPGRKKWKDWVSHIWRSSRIHDRIVAVFAASNCHPLHLPRSETETSTWPTGGTWIPLCLDAIALELFGEDCLDAYGRLPERFRGPTQAIAQRTWTNLIKRLERCQKRFSIYEQEAIAAFDSLNNETLTKAKVTTVIRAVAKWRNISQILDTPENLLKIAQMETELEKLMEGFGAKVINAKTRKSDPSRNFTLSEEKLKSLATEKEIQYVTALYHEHFNNPSNAADDVPLLDCRSLIKIPFGPQVDGVDPGIDYEARLNPEDLAANLGFVARIPLLFNIHRRTDGLTPWTHPDAFKFEMSNVPPEIENLEIHWHQLAGVHALIRICFTTEPLTDHCVGALISDDVGIGKTYQVITLIGFLADGCFRQAKGYAAAPLLQLHPYLAGVKEIPSLPHLILVPGTLISQWNEELRILFSPGSVDIFTYPTSQEEREVFWEPNGLFRSSRQPLSSRIIVASHSALQKDFSSLYTTKAKKYGALPWEIPAMLPAKQRADVSKTLFGQKYLSVTLDEAHQFRNHGAKHLAALAILEKTIIRLILTATPLQTATKDLAAMARLTGIAHFFTPAAWEEEKEDIRALRRARKDLPDDYDPLEENDHDAIKLCQVVIAQRMQRQTQGHVLRRTTDSLNWLGKPLVSLPPCNTVYAYLDLTPRELKIITANGQSLKESVGTANMSMKLFTRGFYMEYRISVIYARSHLAEDIPIFKSLEEWEKVKSTKLDTAVRLCRYLLTRDDLPLPIFKEGTVDFPPIPPARQGKAITQNCKIVIFTEFPSMITLIHNIFDLYNIKLLAVNGTMAFEKRAAIIKQFREDPTCRVLALSSVGTTGINLAFCRVIIFLDQPWSAQDVRQMRGRVHRQPQKHNVLCIYLLANDTADILVSGMAHGKRDMMEAYLSKKAGQGKSLLTYSIQQQLTIFSEMFELLSGGGGSIPEDDESDPDEKIVSKQPKKPKQVEAEEEEEEAEVLVSLTPKLKKPKAKSSRANTDLDSVPPPNISKHKPKSVVQTSSLAPLPAKTKEKSKPAVADSDAEPAPPPTKSKPKSKARSRPVTTDSDAESAPPPTKSKSKSKARSRSVITDSDAEPAPPPTKSKPKSKARSRSVITDSDAEPAPPPTKSKAKSKPAVANANANSALSLPRKLKVIFQSAITTSDTDFTPLLPQKLKANSQLVIADSDAEPTLLPTKPKSKSKARSKRFIIDSDAEPASLPTKSKVTLKPAAASSEANTATSSTKPEGKLKSTGEESTIEDSDVDPAPPRKKPKVKSKPVFGDSDIDPAKAKVKSTLIVGITAIKPAQPQRKSGLKSLHFDPTPLPESGSSKSMSTAKINARPEEDEEDPDMDEDEEYDEEQDKEANEKTEEGTGDDDDNNDDNIHSTKGINKGKQVATTTNLDLDESNNGDDYVNTDHDEQWNPSDVDIPIQSEFSSNSSLRSRTSSDASMNSLGRSASDKSMDSIAAPYINLPTTPPPNDANNSTSSSETGNFRRKRSFQNASPASPSDYLPARLAPSRRRADSQHDYEDTDARSQDLSAYYKPFSAEQIRNARFHSNISSRSTAQSMKTQPQQSRLPFPQAVDLSLTARASTARVLASAPKNAASTQLEAPSTSQASTQPYDKFQRNQALTFDRLRGYSRQNPSTAAGPSSSSTSLATPAIETNPIVSAHGSSIPIHRHPSLFERQAIGPPPPLPAKKANPFGTQYKPSQNKGGKKRL